MPRFEQALLAVDEIPEDGSRPVEFFGRQIHIVRDAHGNPPHSWTRVSILEGHWFLTTMSFAVNGHGATYELRTGRRTGGPAAPGTQLMRLPTVVNEGLLTYVWGSDD